MPRNIAKAHIKTDRKYSEFHRTLLGEKEGDTYALHHLYSVEATKHLMFNKWGWSADEVRIAADNLTIDVMKNTVYIHVPNKITKRGETIKVRGISRYVSKAEYVEVLIDRAWSKADPYKLQPGSSWDQFIAMGNTGDFYEVKIFEGEVTCTCHAYSGLKKAFEQDAIAFKCLLDNPKTKGQLPDKHTFAVWKYLNCESFTQYQHQFSERHERFLEENQNLKLRFNQRSWEIGDIEF